MREGWHDRLGGGGTINDGEEARYVKWGSYTRKVIYRHISTFKENELYNCNPHKILHSKDITCVLVTVPP